MIQSTNNPGYDGTCMNGTGMSSAGHNSLRYEQFCTHATCGCPCDGNSIGWSENRNRYLRVAKSATYNFTNHNTSNTRKTC